RSSSRYSHGQPFAVASAVANPSAVPAGGMKKNRTGRSKQRARATSSLAVNWRTRLPDTDPSACATVAWLHGDSVNLDSRSASSLPQDRAGPGAHPARPLADLRVDPPVA